MAPCVGRDAALIRQARIARHARTRPTALMVGTWQCAQAPLLLPHWAALQLVQNSSSNSSGGSRDPGEPATDDLLFFVAAPGAAARPRDEAYFVRRKAKQLPADLQLSGERFDKVDWKASVLLNIVLQGQFSLTVVTCG